MLTRYAALGASSRVRAYQFVPALAAAGFDVRVAPLLPDAYLHRLYAGEAPPKPMLARAYARRVGQVLAARRADVVWIEKELMPWAPAWLESGLLAGVPYAIDYDDATFHTYDEHPKALVRRFLGGKIDRLMREAALVIAGNAYLAERAERAGARRVEILPSVIDLARYETAPPRTPGAPFTVGWIGSAGSDRVLDAIAPVLRDLTVSGKIRLRLIGSDGRHLDGVRFESRPWSEETEVEEMHDFDVGIMPLPDEPWMYGKCGYKLIQYMGCGIPVVATPFGVNAEIAGHGTCGILATTPEQWGAALSTLAADPAMREAMGDRGRARVEGYYSLDVAAPRLVAFLRSLLP